MIVSGHEMHLYCDGDGCERRFGGEVWRRSGETVIIGQSVSGCRKTAIGIGWKIGPKLEWCLCPECVKEGRKRK